MLSPAGATALQFNNYRSLAVNVQKLSMQYNTYKPHTSEWNTVVM